MDRKISELDQVLNLDEQAEFPLSQDNGGTSTTFKAKLTQLAAKIAEAITFSNLITNDKHIIGAINEAAQGSGASMKFEDLSDVDISNLQDGQFSKYDSTTEKWKNTTIQESDVANLVSDLADKADKTDLVYEKTASGSIATFSDGGDDIPVSEYECEIVAQQASGTPTPTSPLSITGFSQADIPVCGLNIFDEEMEVGTLDNSTGETGTDANKMRSVNFIPVKPNTTYGVYNNTGVNLYIYSYGSDKSFIGFDNTGMVTGSTFTTDSNTHYIKFRTQNNPSYSNNISINYPSTDIDYHAYKGNTYLVEFGQTIYGGRLIYKNGQWAIEATQKYFSYTEVMYYGTYGSDNANLYYMEIPNYTTEIIKNISNVTHTDALLSNMLSKISTVSPSDLKNNEIRTQDASNPRYFYFRADSFASLADLNAVLANTPLQVVAELATPIIIPITSSTRIKTISGVNNIYSNTGDNSVKYFTENADSLAELIKASESESTGDYHEYSTEEHIVGKWIDGSTVYEKTIHKSSITLAMSSLTAVEDLTSLNIDTFIGCEIVKFIVDGNINVTDGLLGIHYNSTTKYLNAQERYSDRSITGELSLTIRYTKTSSNTRSLNLSKGVEETEEKTEEIKTEEVKEEEK